MIFVDTGAWIAFSDRYDQYHTEATRIYTKLKQEQERFLTTDYVIDETMTRLRYDLKHASAVKFLDFIKRAQKGGVLKVIFVDEDIYQEAEEIFRNWKIKIPAISRSIGKKGADSLSSQIEQRGTADLVSFH